MAHILLVDDEPSVTSALRRSLRVLRADWTVHTATSGADALELMDTQHFDVIVSDMRMPQMDGATLLAHVRERHPGTVRLILSGHTAHESLMRSVGPAHQFLAKPCEPAVLSSTIERMLDLRARLHDDRMIPILGGVQSLPKRPLIFEELIDALAEPSTPFAKTADIIQSDIALTAEVLRLANSPYFGHTGTIDSVDRAIACVGLETLHSVVLGAHTFQIVGEPSGIDLDRIWQHSLRVATMMRAIATLERWTPNETAQAFLCGLLHAVGLLFLAAAQPTTFAAHHRPSGPGSTDHETNHFGCTQFEAGAYLLGLWGFPFAIIEAIAAQPATDDAIPLAYALTIANIAAAGHNSQTTHADGRTPTEQHAHWQTECVRVGGESPS